MTDLFSINDKVFLLTGATGILGGKLAVELAQRGAKIGVLGRNEGKINALVDEINSLGKERAIGLIANVLDTDQLGKAADSLIQKWGKIDVLINGAGGNTKEAVVGPDDVFTEMSAEALNEVVDLNLAGTFLPTKIVVKRMMETGGGIILNISSMASMRPLTRVVGYSAAKAAVNNFTQWLSTELATKYGEKFRVNAIAPGFFLTSQNRDLLTESDGKLTQRGETIIAHTPMGRFGEPEDLVGTVVWLCSDASRFVTGTVIPVDGGFSAFGGV